MAIAAKNLFGNAREVRVIELPGLPPKGDLFDWIEAGGTLETLLGIVRETPVVDQEILRSLLTADEKLGSQTNTTKQESAAEDSQRPGSDKKKTLATEIVELLLAQNGDLFHTQDERAFVTVRIADHWET